MNHGSVNENRENRALSPILTILRSVKSYIEFEKESGTEELFSSQPAAGSAKTSASGDVKQQLEALKKEVLRCRACGLSKTRLNVVFGAGNSRARLMFVGEAPGSEEDIQGLPFVGRAGQLLTKIIEAMGLEREDVYIANILKCRPPNNRAPLPEEISACRENVRRQIAIIKPKVICTLGKFASQTLLNTETTISRLRGSFYEYEGIKVMPTFHPAYLLRNPQDKKLAWADMKKIKKLL
ncbi:MAG: uracil-DNA glycosylase [Candidatus Omnitrophica bacterium]|nr:uracil-DNA glycosylase [Candidatus Omnitrophota bacterium]